MIQIGREEQGKEDGEGGREGKGRKGAELLSEREKIMPAQ